MSLSVVRLRQIMTTVYYNVHDVSIISSETPASYKHLGFRILEASPGLFNKLNMWPRMNILWQISESVALLHQCMLPSHPTEHTPTHRQVDAGMHAHTWPGIWGLVEYDQRPDRNLRICWEWIEMPGHMSITQKRPFRIWHYWGRSGKTAATTHF